MVLIFNEGILSNPLAKKIPGIVFILRPLPQFILSNLAMENPKDWKPFKILFKPSATTKASTKIIKALEST
jgi:hypothetical protein